MEVQTDNQWPGKRRCLFHVGYNHIATGVVSDFSYGCFLTAAVTGLLFQGGEPCIYLNR